MVTSVLLVEDDEDDYFLVEEALSQFNGAFSLSWSQTYNDAVEQLKKHHPMVCLIDYRLGGFSGLDLIKHAIGSGVEAPLILMTGAGYNEGLDEKALVVGADDYISKEEITPQLLKRTLLFNIQRKDTEKKHRNAEAELRQLNEISSSTLHNIGNVLNNLGISLQDIQRNAKSIPFKRLGDIGEMILNGISPEKLKLVPEYLGTVSETIQDEIKRVNDSVQDCSSKLSMAIDAIEIQQNSMRARNKERLSPAKILTEAFQLHRSKMIRENIDFLIDNSLDVEIVFNRATLLHIMINLVKNAIDALHGQDDKCIYAGLSQSNDWMVITIRDTGCGIRPEMLKKLFVHGYTTKLSGNGFGLHFCREVLAREGCEIEAHSEGLGKGATISVRFPSAYLQASEAA